jgi:uncharacterized membrane protein YkvA (DUF1232 family)
MDKSGIVDKTQKDAGILRATLNTAALSLKLLFDTKVSFGLKIALLAIAGAYVIWPADIVPDIFPALGQVDDLGFLLIMMKTFVLLCPKEVVEKHQGKDQ